MSDHTKILIRKASDELEHFEVSKLIRSLQRAGADSKTAKKIAQTISTSLFEGISSKKIYSMAFRLLRKQNRFNALLYKLKQSLLELGPTGYPFEHFIGELFLSRGFEIEVGKIVDGFCIKHEIDVIATHKTKQILIECKYSKDQGKRVPIQVPLYVRSRVDDIIKKRSEIQDFSHLTFAAGIACNTRFSSESIVYSRCNGIELLGWDYPQGKGLKEIIEQEKIYPITLLENLTKKQKELLMQQGIVTCNQLHSSMKVLDKLLISKKKLIHLEDELDDILNY